MQLNTLIRCHVDFKIIKTSLFLLLIILIIVHRILCGLILYLCLIGTLSDIVISFLKKTSEPVNNRNGYIPIRDDSPVTFEGDVPDSCTGSGAHSSNTTQFMNPSPKAAISASTRLTSFSQKRDEPCK